MPNTPSAPKESTPKKLSGATMNMRFMKRKQERQEQEQQRKRLSTDGNTSAPSINTPDPYRPSAPLLQPVDHTSRDDGADAVEMDLDLDMPTSSRNELPYQVATPIDMYDTQASLIGRRSFGGFNVAMEEAWKQSQETLKERSSRTNNSKKVTDEELIERYQEIVNKRSESSRPVGNLRDKATPKRQRRSSK